MEEGEIFGFLGPNGAGKTTAIKILTTLIPHSGGRASVLGYDISSQGPEIRRRIGVVQQQESYELNLSAERSLELYGLLWDMSKGRRSELTQELLDRFGLTDFRKVKASDLSVGLRRRLQVAREFMHDMDLLFLDEPTTGLDPVVRRDALDFFKRKAREGMTIFFTTHILEEAEYLCDRVALINGGKLVTIDTPEAVKRRFGGNKTVELKVKLGFPAQFEEHLRALEGTTSISSPDERTMAVVTSSPDTVISYVLGEAKNMGLDISSIYVAEPSLEEAFINLIKEGSS